MTPPYITFYYPLGIKKQTRQTGFFFFFFFFFFPMKNGVIYSISLFLLMSFSTTVTQCKNSSPPCHLGKYDTTTSSLLLPFGIKKQLRQPGSCFFFFFFFFLEKGAFFFFFFFFFNSTTPPYHLQIKNCNQNWG